MKRSSTLRLMLIGCTKLKRDHSVLVSFLNQIHARVLFWDSDEDLSPISAAESGQLDKEPFFLRIDKQEAFCKLLLNAGVMMITVNLPLHPTSKQVIAIEFAEKLMDDLFEELQGQLGYVDLDGDEPEDMAYSPESTGKRWLFWINYFGQGFVAKMGADHLRSAPFLNIEQLDPFSFKCSIKESPYETVDPRRARELVKYFGGDDKCAIYDSRKFQTNF